MQEKQEEEVRQCDECNQVPDNYLSLNCGHCFCLTCMATNFIKGGRTYKIKGEDQHVIYICQLCEQETPLDEASVDAVQRVIQELILSVQQQQQQTVSKCDIHPKEDANLFCFTCEKKCFCIQCLLKHENKTHEICNVGSCLKKLKSKMNETIHTIAASLELMQLQQKRLLSEDATHQEELDGMIKQVSEQFKQLYEALQNKENEFIQQLTNIRELQQQQSEKIGQEIQMKINSLIGLKNDFENIGLSEQLVLFELIQQPSVSLLNFYSECKSILSKVIGQISFGDIFCQELKYFPNNESLFQYDEFDYKMQNLKQYIDKLFNSQFRSISSHDKQQPKEFNLTQRYHTQMDESTDSLKTHQISLYSKIHTPINNQRSLRAKFEEIKNLHSDRVQTQSKLNRMTEHQSVKDLESQIQRSFSELASFKKQTALSALRAQQGLFDSRVTKKPK